MDGERGEIGHLAIRNDYSQSHEAVHVGLSVLLCVFVLFFYFTNESWYFEYTKLLNDDIKYVTHKCSLKMFFAPHPAYVLLILHDVTCMQLMCVCVLSYVDRSLLAMTCCSCLTIITFTWHAHCLQFKLYLSASDIKSQQKSKIGLTSGKP